ncbi:MAG TPA: beta-galactosidase GalA [Verrucomicrobiae bacterium]
MRIHKTATCASSGITLALLFRTLRAGACAVLFAAQLAAAQSPREHLSLDLNWKFHLGDDWPNASDLSHLGTSTGPITERFNDSAWRAVNLPHDWGIELPFDRNGDKDHGYRPLGRNFPSNSIAWYRRTFELPSSDSGKRIWLTFDGAFRDTTVWVNGWLVRHHEGGYNPFREDITDVVHFGGKNTVAVRVDATKFEGWFYEGAGIYRHVWLDVTSPVAVAPDGIFVATVIPVSDLGRIQIQTQVRNSQSNSVAAKVNCEIRSPEGKLVGTTYESADLAPWSETQFNELAVYLMWDHHFATLGLPRGQEMVKHTPELWSPESPKLYKLITTVSVAGKIVDKKETAFGIRTVDFDATNGFLLNGKRYELQGVCIHQDWPGVGVAVPDSLQYFRVSRLKEMGCNAIRTSHNPPAPGFLDACDQLGILVMDEHRLPGGDTESLRKWDDQIRRDRNHPSVAIWCLGNEERGVEDTPQGANVARSMQDLVKRLDPTRPVTYAAPEGDVFRGINSVIEVRGWNYYLATNNTDRYHAEHPTQPEVCTEQGSIVSTRGIYANDRQRGYISSYDTNWPGWTPPNAMWLWSYVAARPWLSGVFVWAGFDYAGEPSPNSWPNINSQFGILDRCGFPKDTFYYYQSWWQTNAVLHLLPHWNWPGREGQDIRVVAYSNCKQVELFLNGVSLGRQVMAVNSDLAWQVKYAPGTLSAKGFDDAGKVIAETKVETTGDATQIQLTPDRKMINADGEDVAVFTVSALDAQGRTVPVAQNKIAFAIEGAGKIIGVGNGDPSCHEPDTFAGQAAPQWSRSLFNGLAQIIVQSTRDAGEIKLTATADGLTPATAVEQTLPCTPRPAVP